MKKTLLLIDLQPIFLKEIRKSVLNLLTCVQHEIDSAIKAKNPIIVVEFRTKQIKDTTTPHLVLPKKTHFVTKNERDGSKQIMRLIQKKKLPDNFRICGIFTDECVFETAEGLTSFIESKKIEIVLPACSSASYSTSQTRLFKELGVELVNYPLKKAKLNLKNRLLQ